MDRYNQLSSIGRGAHGICYLCELKQPNSEGAGDRENQNPMEQNKKKKRQSPLKVVVKKVAIEGLEQKALEATLGEVHLLRMLQHQNVIFCYESFIDRGYLCLVLEYANGGALDGLISDAKRANIRLPNQLVMDYFCQMLCALNYLHSRRVLHRDLKPANILLFSSANDVNRQKKYCKICDFGCSKLLGAGVHEAWTCIGTQNYIAPEMMLNHPYDHKADIWSLGCILYEMLSLERAFPGQNGMQLWKNIMNAKFESLENDPEVDEHLADMVEQMLQVNYSQRPDTQEILAEQFILRCTARRNIDINQIIAELPSEKMLPYLLQNNHLDVHRSPAG